MTDKREMAFLDEIDFLLSEHSCLHRQRHTIRPIGVLMMKHHRRALDQEAARQLAHSILRDADWERATDPNTLDETVDVSAYVLNREKMRKLLEAAIFAGYKKRAEVQMEVCDD